MQECIRAYSKGLYLYHTIVHEDPLAYRYEWSSTTDEQPLQLEAEDPLVHVHDIVAQTVDRNSYDMRAHGTDQHVGLIFVRWVS